MIRAILFDLDGTLVDSYEAITQSLNTALGHFERDALAPHAIRKMVGHGLESLVAQALQDEKLASEGGRIFRERYKEIYLDKTYLLAGVAATVGRLSDRGKRMAVCSNKPSYFGRPILDRLGIGCSFELVLGPDLTSRPKPDPEMLTSALRQLEADPAEALYVGDMRLDVVSGHAAGLPVALVATGSEPASELANCGADHLLDCFEEIEQLVD